MKSTEPTPNTLALAKPADGPLRLPDCADPKTCRCSRDCNVIRPTRIPDYVWNDLLTGGPGPIEAFQGPLEPMPIYRTGIDPKPQTDCYERPPTLDEMAAIENLVDRACALACNPELSIWDRATRWDLKPQDILCEPFRLLVTSVKNTFPFGFAVQGYIDPLWEPSRKFYPHWYKPYRPYSKPNWLDIQPNLFDAFGVEPPPECTLRKDKDGVDLPGCPKRYNGFGEIIPGCPALPESCCQHRYLNDYLRDLYQNGPDVSDDEFEEMAKAVTPFEVMHWRLWSKEKSSDFIFKDAVRVYEGDCYLDAD
jgi:hypothetical protein